MNQPDFVRLSESPIWELQRAYFEAHGPRAWSTGTVPHYVTCNPFMARALSEVIVGFAADRARTRGPTAEPRTLYIVELGAGAGRLAYNVVRALRGALELAIAGWRAVYVMTDLVEETVAWWQHHPSLRPLAEAGLIDFARFDAVADRALQLRVSGRTIDAVAPADDLVVVANYVFDSLPQDVFHGDGGYLHECLTAVPELVADPHSGFVRAPLSWRTRRAAADYYGDEVRDGILAGYAHAGGVFSFPTAGLDVLDGLRSLTRGALLVLSADKGGVRLADVVQPAPPVMVTHGSVSMAVNYHALGQWTLGHGGTWLHTEHRHRSLEVCAFLLGADDHRATLAAFDRAIAQRGPDDFYALKRILVSHAGEMELGELLAYLRLSGHDAKLFLDCAPGLRVAAARASAAELDDLALVIERVWAGWLPIGEARDLGDELQRLVRDLTAPSPVAPAKARARRLPPADDPFDVITGQVA